MRQGQTLILATGLAMAMSAPVAARTTIQTAAQRTDWRLQTVEGGLADGTATHAENTIRLVKGNGNRPSGWEKGNKTGWRGRDLPPGQAKKQDRDRYDRHRGDRDDRDSRDSRDDRYRRDRNNNGIPDDRERDRDRDGIPDYRDRNTARPRTDRARRGDGFIDRNNNGVDDRREDRYYRYNRDNEGNGYNSGSTSTVLGTVTGGNSRAVNVRMDNGGIRTYTLQRGAVIRRGGRTLSTRELRSGDRVQMRVVGGNQISSIVVY